MKVRNRTTGETYNCMIQALDLNFNGRYVLRYNIGILNYQGHHMIECIYNNDEFNERYEVIEEQKGDLI